MKNENNKEKFVNNEFTVCFFSSLAGILILGIFILIFSVVGVLLDLGNGFAVAAGCISLAFASIFSGYICLLKNKRRGLMYGTVCGVMLFAVLIIVSFLTGDEKFTVSTLFHLIICVLGGEIGGIFSANRHGKIKII